MQSEHLINKLNCKNAFLRRLVLKNLKKLEKNDKTLQPVKTGGANLSIHTDYSFSPYSPALAAYMAYKSGMELVALCDVGTTSAANEFNACCKILDLKTICGFEVFFKSEKLGTCLASFYGINKNNAVKFEEPLKHFRDWCEERTRKALKTLNKQLKSFDIFIDYETDVQPLIKHKKGGVVTLKHLYMAEAEKIVEKCGKGKKTADFLRNELCLDITEGEYNLLCDSNNPYYLYDLLASLRGKHRGDENLDFPAKDEFMSIAAETGVIVAYEYTCKHGWLELETEAKRPLAKFSALLDKVKDDGFNAVCLSSREYSKNALPLFINAIQEKGLLVILTDKTEYPRTCFNSAVPEQCKKYVEACSYALLGNAMSISENESEGLFTDKTLIKCPEIEKRINIFSAIGKNGMRER